MFHVNGSNCQYIFQHGKVANITVPTDRRVAHIVRVPIMLCNRQVKPSADDGYQHVCY